MKHALNPAIPALMQPAARHMRETLPVYDAATAPLRALLTSSLPDHGDGGKRLWQATIADVTPLRKRV